MQWSVCDECAMMQWVQQITKSGKWQFRVEDLISFSTRSTVRHQTTFHFATSSRRFWRLTLTHVIQPSLYFGELGTVSDQLQRLHTVKELHLNTQATQAWHNNWQKTINRTTAHLTLRCEFKTCFVLNTPTAGLSLSSLLFRSYSKSKSWYIQST